MCVVCVCVCLDLKSPLLALQPASLSRNATKAVVERKNEKSTKNYLKSDKSLNINPEGTHGSIVLVLAILNQ